MDHADVDKTTKQAIFDLVREMELARLDLACELELARMTTSDPTPTRLPDQHTAHHDRSTHSR